MNISRNSYNNMSLNINTRLPKIESLGETDSESALKIGTGGTTGNKPTSPTHVNLNTNSVIKKNSIDYGQVTGENLKSQSILSMNASTQNINKNELASNSLTNTNNKTHGLNSNSNTYFGSHNNVFILEETYKLNNSTDVNSNGFYKNSLKRGEMKQSNSKMEGLNLPQVKQIERK